MKSYKQTLLINYVIIKNYYVSDMSKLYIAIYSNLIVVYLLLFIDYLFYLDINLTD